MPEVFRTKRRQLIRILQRYPEITMPVLVRIEGEARMTRQAHDGRAQQMSLKPLRKTIGRPDNFSHGEGNHTGQIRKTNDDTPDAHGAHEHVCADGNVETWRPGVLKHAAFSQAFRCAWENGE